MFRYCKVKATKTFEQVVPVMVGRDPGQVALAVELTKLIVGSEIFAAGRNIAFRMAALRAPTICLFSVVLVRFNAAAVRATGCCATKPSERVHLYVVCENERGGPGHTERTQNG